MQEESGAVTVDWVVMTASLVGLGLAVSTTLSPGLRQTAEATRDLMSTPGIVKTAFSGFVERTSGLVESFSKSRGDRISELRNAKVYSFAMDVTLAAGDTGILYEAGGTGTGTILYQHDGKLYLQSGKGNATGPSSDRGEAVWDVRDGSYTIEGSLDANSGLSLYVNGTLVSEASFKASSLSGGNEGMVGAGYRSIARNRGGFGSSDGHPGAGELRIFKDQTIP